MATRVTYDGTVIRSDRNNARTKIVERVRPRTRVLDVGCATGAISEYLKRELGCSVIGVEIDPGAAAIAADRGIEVVVGSAEEKSLFARIEGQFDHVIFADSIEHFVDPATVLAQATSKLARSGIVLASIPNVAHWSIRWRLAVGRFDYMEAGILDRNHLRFFTQRTIENLFRTVGLEPRFDYVHALPRLLPLGQRAAERLTYLFPRMFAFQYIVSASRE